MKREKDINFGVIDAEEEVPRLKEIFRGLTGRETTLSDDDIVNIVAASDDDKVDYDWVKDMLFDEQLPDLPEKVEAATQQPAQPQPGDD